MRNELRYGRIKFLSFIGLDVLCLALANYLAAKIYLIKTAGEREYKEYFSIVFFMIIIDLIVTAFLKTLDKVLRRKKRIEMLQGVKHVGFSFVVLAAALFSMKAGAAYSRVTVYLAYGLYFLFFVGVHMLWKSVLRRVHATRGRKTALLMTTDRFVDEGLKELEKSTEVRYIFLLKNFNRDEINGIPVVKSAREAASAICWKQIDKVLVYGLDNQMIPARLKKYCQEMSLDIDTVDFEYRVLDLKTIPNENPKYGALSFLESERDIPFPIRRVYWITETEADLHRGFHAHKLNCQLLFCPHGKIDILLDDGKEKTVVTLEGPGKGLLLMPGMWREMVWRETGSVLCVLASEYYDPDEYIRNYDEFIAYKEKNKEDQP